VSRLRQLILVSANKKSNHRLQVLVRFFWLSETCPKPGCGMGAERMHCTVAAILDLDLDPRYEAQHHPPHRFRAAIYSESPQANGTLRRPVPVTTKRGHLSWLRGWGPCFGIAVVSWAGHGPVAVAELFCCGAANGNGPHPFSRV
jgi:hypothetical protein